jgi:hypothetical protein
MNEDALKLSGYIAEFPLMVSKKKVFSTEKILTGSGMKCYYFKYYME